MVFYVAGCDSATTSKTSKNTFSNKYQEVLKSRFLGKNKIMFNKKNDRQTNT